MLHEETVSARTLEILMDLMQDQTLRNFFLVGGTALSLQIGHRVSIDIDLFTQQPFDQNTISAHLESKKGFQLSYIDKNTIKGQIDSVQVDMITHEYPLIKDCLTSKGIRLASLEDIAAMKLNAIIGNGTRLKDFIDVAFLSSHLSLERMTVAYQKKYQSRNLIMVPKALLYHEDINFVEPIKFVRGEYQWPVIEKRLKGMVSHTNKLFSPL